MLAAFLLNLEPILSIDVVIEQRVQDDYLEFGVSYVWVIDPSTRRAWTYARNEIREVNDGALRTQNPNITVPFTAIFPDASLSKL